MKKFTVIMVAGIIAVSGLTGCEKTPQHSGEVTITEMKHTDERARVGKMPSIPESWEVRVCPTEKDLSVEVKCSLEGVNKDQFEKLSVGQDLTMDKGNLALP